MWLCTYPLFPTSNFPNSADVVIHPQAPGKDQVSYGDMLWHAIDGDLVKTL